VPRTASPVLAEALDTIAMGLTGSDAASPLNGCRGGAVDYSFVGKLRRDLKMDFFGRFD